MEGVDKMTTGFCRRTRKVQFHTELDAKIALAPRVRKDKGEIRYYQCEFCNGWHLSSQDADPNRRMHA
jgi:hypothetical protein